MKNHKEDDLTLLGSVFKGLNVYFNYTGTSTCLNILSSTPSLDAKGWDYQVLIPIDTQIYFGQNLFIIL